MTSLLFSTTTTFLIAGAGLLILLGSLILSLCTRLVQLRMLPRLARLFIDAFHSRHKRIKNLHAINSYKALFTAMSTTIGIASIVSPIFAIKMGGPGALIGFMLTIIFGSATTFTEVTLALHYRKKLPNGTIMGGPMQYLKQGFSPMLAAWYAFWGCLLLVAWSANQSNTIADVLQPFGIPTWLSGIGVTITILLALLGGIKRVSNLASRMVPIMFILYVSASLWIVIANISGISAMLSAIFGQFFSLKSWTYGAASGSILHTLRWGLLKGMHSTEAGIGTAAIPHSMADTKNPFEQGVLAMASVWSVGFISLLTGCVVLLTNSWQDPTLGKGINVIIHSFSQYFPSVGPIILVISAFLFAFGTTLGNSYNGSQCFLYLTNNKYLRVYQLLLACALFFGTVVDVAFIWSVVDLFMVCVAVPNIVAIVVLAFRKRSLLEE